MDTLQVPKDEAPGVVIFPVLRLPGVLVGAPPLFEFPMIGAYVATTTKDSNSRESALTASGLAKANPTVQIPLGPFYQVLAHVAYSQIVGHSGYDPDNPLRKIATGESTFLASHLIGGTPPEWVFIPEPEHGRGLHQMALVKCEAQGRMYDVIQIRLFTYLKPLPPVYSAVFNGPGVREGTAEIVKPE